MIEKETIGTILRKGRQRQMEIEVEYQKVTAGEVIEKETIDITQVDGETKVEIECWTLVKPLGWDDNMSVEDG